MTPCELRPGAGLSVGVPERSECTMARAKILGCCNHAISLLYPRTPSPEVVSVGTNPPSVTLVDPLKRNGLDSLFMRGVS